MGFAKRNPSFMLLWVGQVLSQAGGRVFQMAMIWWILGRFTEAPGSLVGTFMVMTALPSILLVKHIGATVDRSSSQKLLVICDLLAFIVVGSAALLASQGSLSIIYVFVTGLLAAGLQAHIDPTLNKAVQEVAVAEDVEGAVSLLAATQSMANFAGAVAGALLIDRAGIGGTAAIAAAGYLISSSCTALAKFRFAITPDAGSQSHAGWAILRDYPLVKRILIGFGAINFFATPTLVVLPIYVKQTLGASATTLGSLEASLWLGLLSGSLLAKFVTIFESRVKLGAVCLFIFGVGLSVPGFIQNLGLYGAALFIAGTALGINNVKFIALFQETVDEKIKGRFFALMQALIGFTFPIAYFLFGALTDVLSPPQVCLIQGSGVILLAIYFLNIARFETTQRELTHQGAHG